VALASICSEGYNASLRLRTCCLLPLWPSLAWPGPFRVAAYRVKIISGALKGSGLVLWWFKNNCSHQWLVSVNWLTRSLTRERAEESGKKARKKDLWNGNYEVFTIVPSTRRCSVNSSYSFTVKNRRNAGFEQILWEHSVIDNIYGPVLWLTQFSIVFFCCEHMYRYACSWYKTMWQFRYSSRYADKNYQHPK